MLSRSNPHFLRQLDARLKLYPGGLPKRLLHAAKARQALNQLFCFAPAKAKAAIFFCDDQWGSSPSAEPFTGLNGELLAAIVSKGMGLQAQVLLMGAHNFSAELYEDALLKCSTLPLLVLARSSHKRGWQDHEAKKIFFSLSLSQIRESAELKKEFWKDLKTFCAVL